MGNFTADLIDLFIFLAWTYANGYAVGWLIPALGFSPHQTGSFFAFMGWLLAIWGIEIRRGTGRFPLLLSFLIFVPPFVCTLFAGVWWVLNLILGT